MRSVFDEIFHTTNDDKIICIVHRHSTLSENNKLQVARYRLQGVWLHHYIIDALAAMHARVKRRHLLVSYCQTGIYTFVSIHVSSAAGRGSGVASALCRPVHACMLQKLAPHIQCGSIHPPDATTSAPLGNPIRCHPYLADLSCVSFSVCGTAEARAHSQERVHPSGGNTCAGGRVAWNPCAQVTCDTILWTELDRIEQASICLSLDESNGRA
jgi:hypothetical protein